MEIFSEGRMTTMAMDREIARAEMQELLRRIAGPSGSVEARIANAARRLGWGYRRVKGHWYGEARTLDDAEMRAARAAAELAERRAEEAQAHAEIAELRARLARIETLLAAVDEDFHGPARDALRQSVGIPGRMADGD